MASPSLRLCHISAKSRHSFPCLISIQSLRRGSRWITQKRLEKIADAEKEWALRAEQIKAGERTHVWDVLNERGFVKDVAGRPEQIRQLMMTKRIGAYAGIDPTASSLHVGHLLPLMPLFWMFFHGFPTYSLIGGATARVGDPTDRLQTRAIMSNSEIGVNITKIHYQLKKIWYNVEQLGRKYGHTFDWAGPHNIANNNTWLNTLPIYDVMKRLGRHVRIGPMLSRETVKRKMTEGDGMSFAEFTYPLLQGWDFWHLYSRNGVQMQVGGSDQFGNIVSGVDVVKTVRASEEAPHARIPDDWTHEPIGFTVPLLTDASGTKFGKSAGNAVWLDNILTSPFDLYGYFVRRSDEEVESLLRFFTFLPLRDIETLMARHRENPPARVAQHTLAFETLSLIHGPEVAIREQSQHLLMFGKTEVAMPEGTIPVHLKGKKLFEPVEGSPLDINSAKQEMLQLPESLIRGKSIARILYAAGLSKSVTDANTLVRQQGAYVAAAPGPDKRSLTPGNLDWTPVKTWFPEETSKFLIDDRILILRRGKHQVRIVEMVTDDAWKKSEKTYPGEPYTGKLRMTLKMLKEEAEKAGEEVTESELRKRLAQHLNETEESVVVANNPGIEFPKKHEQRAARGQRTLSDKA